MFNKVLKCISLPLHNSSKNLDNSEILDHPTIVGDKERGHNSGNDHYHLESEISLRRPKSHTSALSNLTEFKYINRQQDID